MKPCDKCIFCGYQIQHTATDISGQVLPSVKPIPLLFLTTHTSEPSVMIKWDLVRSLAHELFFPFLPSLPLGVCWLFQPNTKTFTKPWEVKGSKQTLFVQFRDCFWGDFSWRQTRVSLNYVLYPETINTYTHGCLDWTLVFRQLFHTICTTYLMSSTVFHIKCLLCNT